MTLGGTGEEREERPKGQQDQSSLGSSLPDVPYVLEKLYFNSAMLIGAAQPRLLRLPKGKLVF